MFCKNCGNEITEGKFCNVCGTPVDDSTPIAPAQSFEQAAPVVIPSPEFTPADPAGTVDPGKSGGTASLVLGIIGLALGTICSCLFACLGGIIPLGCAIAGIIVGTQATKKSQAAGFKNNNARVGTILSIVALVIISVFIVLNGILGGVLALVNLA